MRTTCSWAKERQTGAHQKVQREERMKRCCNVKSNKQNKVVTVEGYGKRYCRRPLEDKHSRKQ